jgi:hypothetical protein
MPLYADGTAITIQAGQRQAVLNAEDLSDGAATQAVLLKTSGGAPVPLTILNTSGEGVTLEVAAEDTEDAYVPWANIDTSTFGPATANAQYGQVTGNLYYRLVAGGDVTAGTLVMAI